MSTDEKITLEWESYRHQFRMDKLIAQSRLPSSALALDFSDFVTTTDMQKEALKVAKDACRDQDNEYDKWSLTFRGTPGTGKTMLACLIGKYYLMEREQSVIYWNVSELVDYLNAGYRDYSYYDRIKEVENCDVLILDELAEKADDDKIYQILEHRYSNKFFTVIATNRKLVELPPRIASRLVQGEFLTMKGDDTRELIAQGKVKDQKLIRSSKTELNTSKHDIGSWKR